MRSNKSIVEFVTLMNDYEMTENERNLMHQIVKSNHAIFDNTSLLPVALDSKRRELLREVKVGGNGGAK